MAAENEKINNLCALMKRQSDVTINHVEIFPLSSSFFLSSFSSLFCATTTTTMMMMMGMEKEKEDFFTQSKVNVVEEV